MHNKITDVVWQMIDEWMMNVVKFHACLISPELFEPT